MYKKFKENLKRIFLKKELSDNMKRIREKYGYCIIFIAVPTHGNLGDQAIVYSQYKVFESLGLKENIIEIRSCDYERFANDIEKLVQPKDMIIIDGGGNMGTLWIKEEYKMRDVVKRFKNNKIIIFPETIFYSDDEFGRQELKKSKEIYTKHNNLHICVRDKRSYEFITNEYKSIHVEYTPDIVLFLDEIKVKTQRENALLCIRKDKEKVLDYNIVLKIEGELDKRNLVVNYSSTLVDRFVSKETREEELLKKWEEFASAKIIITDRLHGMIFSAITGTPCIALNNSNGKVKGVYEWIKELPYIIFCDDNSNIEESIDKLLNIEYSSYKEFRDKNLIENFNPIMQMIIE